MLTFILTILCLFRAQSNHCGSGQCWEDHYIVPVVSILKPLVYWKWVGAGVFRRPSAPGWAELHPLSLCRMTLYTCQKAYPSHKPSVITFHGVLVLI